MTWFEANLKSQDGGSYFAFEDTYVLDQSVGMWFPNVAERHDVDASEPEVIVEAEAE